MKSFGFSRFILLMVLLTLMPCAFAQKGTPGSGSGNSGATAPSVPIIVTPSTGNRARQVPMVPEIIYIAGSVVQEDGSAPPFGTVIELDCGDTVTREAIVDGEGHYGFQLGSSNRIGRVMADASERIDQDVFDAGAASQNPAAGEFSTSMRTSPLSVRLLRCEVRAQYPGYRSTTVRIRPGTSSGYTEIGTILIYQLTKVQGTSVSVTSMLAPKGARRSVEQAAKLLKKGKYGEAESLLKSSTAIYPANAESWFLLGEVYRLQNRAKEARNSYSRALQADPLYVFPYLRLARLNLKEEDWKDAADFSDKALALDPIAFPEAYYLNALAKFNLADLDAAERSARRGQRLDLGHQYPQMHLILAKILSARQDAQGAIVEMRMYLKAAPKAEDPARVRARLEGKEKLATADVK
jgi:Flp pilus assembly protein TadD